MLKGMRRIWGAASHSGKKSLPLRTCWKAGDWAGSEGYGEGRSWTQTESGTSCPQQVSGLSVYRE